MKLVHALSKGLTGQATHLRQNNLPLRRFTWMGNPISEYCVQTLPIGRDVCAPLVSQFAQIHYNCSDREQSNGPNEPKSCSITHNSSSRSQPSFHEHHSQQKPLNGVSTMSFWTKSLRPLGIRGNNPSANTCRATNRSRSDPSVTARVERYRGSQHPTRSSNSCQ